jgi:NADH-quinone oxidoreductase subunit C
MAVEKDAPAGTAIVPGPGEDSSVLAALREAFPAVSFKAGALRGQSWAVVPAEHIVAVCRFVRDDPRCDFKMLLDVTAVDLLPRAPRWEVVYSLLSLSRNDRYRLKVEVPEADLPEVPSVVTVWPAANFYEREIFDLMGIAFAGHPNLRRIMLPDDWVGYPLRFDHPLGGEEVSFTS